MTERTIARLTRRQTPHTGWCAQDHRCGAAEHRSPDLTADEIGGRAWLTRVRAGDREYIEIRARIPLHGDETAARAQLATALNLLRDLLAQIAPRALRPSGRRALNRHA